jgi:hypothetical protein
MTTLVCKKCHRALTKPGLYKIPRKHREQPKNSQYYKQRSFIFLDRFKISGYFVINPLAFIDQFQLEYVDGQGCCGNSYTPVMCECWAEVGRQHLDCYESKVLKLDLNKVEEYYE